MVLNHFDMSLGAGLSKLAGQVFRIGHLGDFNELMLMGTLAGVLASEREAVNGCPPLAEQALAILEGRE